MRRIILERDQAGDGTCLLGVFIVTQSYSIGLHFSASSELSPLPQFGWLLHLRDLSIQYPVFLHLKPAQKAPETIATHH